MSALERKHYTVQCVHLEDLPRLLELEEKCWPEHLRVSTEKISLRLKNFPEAQFAIKINAQIAGVIYTQRIAEGDLLQQTTYQEISTLHTAAGSILQLLSINVDPTFQDLGLGDQLLEFVLQWSLRQEDILKIMAVTRCQNYKNSPHLSMDAYLQRHEQQPLGIDPILRFHTSHGAKIVDILPNYRLEDWDNQGSGILIEYSIREDQFPFIGRSPVSYEQQADQQNPFPINTQDTLFFDKVFAVIEKLIPEMYKARFSPNFPLREMGFDSLGLLELRLQINEQFQVKLDSTFFFTYPTPEAIAHCLQGQVSHSFVLANPEERLYAAHLACKNLNPTKQNQKDDIAIIGIGCRFPKGIQHIDDYWHMLEQGLDVVGEIPQTRWKGDETLDLPIYQGGFLTDVDKFDASFFHITPHEAELMDPQQRILLETCWQALEHAGIDPYSLRATQAGVYFGIFSNDYERLVFNHSSVENVDIYFSTGNSPSVAAGRLSYVLGFQGPSMTINTACSSALVAVHLACQSLRNGETALALAGGVNLILSPELSIAYAKAGMLSPEGRCKTFDVAANGYVRSEGCGIVVLKRLSQAIQDQDNILAVIRGSAVNQDGGSNGLTAPNKAAQIALIKTALENAKVTPQSVSYVEAHGTGTSLGDPIEVRALLDVYGSERSKDNPLMLGSVKTNLGHTEGAAGIAGLIKVVLALQKNKIPANLHFKKLNPHIELNQDSLLIPEETLPWLADRDVRRRAGVSSFGFSGTNSHIILEEAPETAVLQGEVKPYYLVTVSAKHLDSLNQQISNLHQFLVSNSGFTIGSVAYTLNKGRSHFQHRLALVASSKEELINQLEQIQKGTIPKNCSQGDTSKKIDDKAIYDEVNFGIKEKIKTTPIGHVEEYKKNLVALGDIYVRGYDLDWDLLHQRERNEKLSLPTYSFLRERYWVTREDSPKQKALHPLLDKNISTFKAQIFQRTLFAKEPYLAHHIVAGQFILPGTAYLEMARAAGSLAADKQVSCLKDVMWQRPIINKGAPVDIRLELIPTENMQGATFQVFTQTDDERCLHMQGELEYASHLTIPVSSVESIRVVIERCKHLCHKTLMYARLKEIGFEYGETFQVTQALYGNENEGVAELRLPAVCEEIGSQHMVLHPMLLDGVVRTIFGIQHQILQPIALQVPFYLESIKIYQKLPSKVYAHARLMPSREQATQGDVFQAGVDIDVLTEQGELCASLRGYQVRTFRQETAKKTIYYYHPQWLNTFVSPSTLIKISGNLLILSHTRTNFLSSCIPQLAWNGDKVHVNLESNPNFHHLLQGFISRSSWPETILHILPHAAWNERRVDTDSSSRTNYLEGVSIWLQFFQAWQAVAPEKSIHYVSVYEADTQTAQPHHAALASLVRAVKILSPNLTMKSLGVHPKCIHQPNWIDYLHNELLSKEDNFVYYASFNQRYIRYLAEIRLPNSVQERPLVFRKEGTYLITGGCGGLGRHFARFLSKHYQARIILLGRSPLDLDKEQFLSELKVLGGIAHYVQFDLGNKQSDLENALFQVVKRKDDIQGILHAAGTMYSDLADTVETFDFSRACQAKIQGTIQLDQVTENYPLDFFITFSSISSEIGDFGAGSYAFSNRFMDEFMNWRSDAVQQGLRRGLSLSIQWPYWAEGGMQLSVEAMQIYRDYSGLGLLDTEQGLASVENCMVLGQSNILVVAGDKEKIEHILAAIPSKKFMNLRNESGESILGNSISKSDQVSLSKDLGTKGTYAMVNHFSHSELHSATENYLKNLLAEVSKIPIDKIQVEEALEQYGIDSVMVMILNKRLSRDFPNIRKTLLFEYRTLSSLAQYFIEHHSDVLATLFGPKKSHVEQITHSVSDAYEPIVPEFRNIPQQVKLEASAKEFSEDSHADGIAIIGLFGRYPQAETLEDFWFNLCEGKDSVIEIPPERWDWRPHFDSSKTNSQKTYSKWGSFIQDCDKFDPSFFNISPKEAKWMDPQERLLLEAAWATLEDGGYAPLKFHELYQGEVGVFVGMMWNEYAMSQSASQSANLNNASIANRISYYFNFSGPSLLIDTACSSSLVSIHMACESIHRGEIQCALAGGVNLSLRPNKYLSLSQMKLLSSEGKCRSFGAGGDGYVPGEGLGLVLLKPLSKALQNRDKIYGVIRSTYVNHGGKTNGFTVPNPDAQAALIKGALNKGNIPSHSISYIEAHGTGTALGDPIEITGLCKAFDGSLPHQSCPVGSVKSNLGHLEGAAGIVGLTKVLLQLKHKQLVPSLHSETLNPYIEFEKTPFYVQRELTDWQPKPGYVRRASISSFGAWGVNAHAIVDEAPFSSDMPVQQKNKPYVLVTLSAKHPDSLKQLINNLYNFLQKTSVISLEDLAYTFHVGRNHFGYRFAIIVADVDELNLALEMFMKAQIPTGCFTGQIEKPPDDKVLYKQVFKNNIEQLKLLPSIKNQEYKKNLEELANLYIQGFELDWELLYQGELHQKISVPTYPFLKKRYWHDEDQNALSSSSPTVFESHQITFNTFSETTSLASSLVNLKVDESGIALIILEDKVRKNQLSKELLIELERTFQKLSDDSKIKTIVITGYEDLFCLGGTEEGLIEIASKEAKFTEISFIYQGFLNCPVPVIAAMQGHAFGAGLTLGLYADMVIMSESHLYTANYMKYGFTPGVGSTLILKEKLTPVLANEMMWTAQDYTGADLKARGAQVTIVPPRDVLSEALRLAQSLAKKPRETLQVFKQQMAKHLLAQLPQAIEKELAMHEEIFSKPTALNNIKSYFEQLTSNKSKALSPTQGASSNPNLLTDIIVALRGIVADRLHFQTNEISISTKFNELGTDSISIVEITRSLNQRFSLNLEAVIMYDYPTIESLADYILTQMKPHDFFLDSSIQVEKKEKEINVSSLIDVKEENSLKKQLQNPQAYEASMSIQNKLDVVSPPILQPSLKLGAPGKIQLNKKDSATDSGLKTPTLQYDILKQGKIAVIGMSGKFPGAKDLDEFWKNLREGCCSVSEIPENRWEINHYFNETPQRPGKTYSKWGGFLDEVDQFDPLFFNLSPLEALEMDPQQRLFLQAAWQALEDAGLNSQQLSNVKCSVFVGVGTGDYGGPLGSEPEAWTAQHFLGMNNAILASRIAYLLNLKGPAIAIDTACSSSLVAIHQACQSILQGESEVVLAGGVSVMATPKMHILCSQMGMLSPMGQCRTFDADADGMVPAEGVGVVVLKSLEKALQDKDRIYGVILGSGVNQDGATNGITAPSARSQEELESTIYSKCGVSPAHITYVEAHGTGTKLGDPIEVKALKQAFKTPDKTNYCAIGSVKTNIGHALTAAGVSSFIKVLLMLRHKTLVPSLHYEKPNDHIDFAQSPFYVNRETKIWDRLNNRPLLAAVSSFGFSGTNAHVIIEEAPEQSLAVKQVKPYYLLTLSAKHPDSLVQQMQNLYTYLDKNSHASLEDITYTLNKGRDHFHFRCAVVASNPEELKALLEKLQDAQIPSSCFKGQVEKKPEDGAIYKKVLKGTFDELRTTISNSLGYKESLEALANLYVKGYDLDWDLLHQGENHQKMHLPTYPFLKESYWLSGMGSLIPGLAQRLQHQNNEILHPLLGSNVSTLKGQCYQTHLQADAFYLNDHVVKGKTILPGVCHLEMARIGGKQLYPREGVCGFKNVVWSYAVEVKRSKDINLHLFPKDNTTYFEVRSQGGIEEILHSQGEIIHGAVHHHPRTLDLLTLQKSLTQELSLSELDCISYEKGFRYGPSFQGLIQWLKHDERRALAYVSLPEQVRKAKDRNVYFLHPSFLDGVLQTTMALTTNPISQGQIYLPFCIEELKWFVNKLPDNAYVFLEKDSQSQEEMPIYNLQVAGDNGELLIEIKGFNARPLKFNKDIEKSKPLEIVSDKAEVVLYSTSLESAPLSALRQDKRVVTGILAINLSPRECERLKALLRCEVIGFFDHDIIQQTEAWAEKIAELSKNISHLLYLPSQKGEDSQHLIVEKLFLLTQMLIKSNSGLVGTIIHCSANPSKEIPFTEMVNGFMKNLAQEQPHFHFWSLSCSPMLSESVLIDLWSTEVLYAVPTGTVIRYEAGQRHEIRFQNINKQSYTSVALPLRSSGTYLITGGLGGLGYLFARYLAQRYQAKLILSGRSTLDKNKTDKIEELQELGAEVLYFEGDISQKQEVQKLLAKVKKRFDSLNGIFHAAGILKDSLLSQKTLEEFRAVLAPKVWGPIHLDALTIEEPLELFVLFSSLSSVLGNRGQADYGTANAFLDNFAHWRQAQVEIRNRNGKTLSINWPLWKEGGMQIVAEEREYLQSMWGLQPLPSEKGLQAFEKLISLPLSQGIVLYGAPQSLVQLDQICTPQESAETNQSFFLTDIALQERIAEDLLKIISKLLKIPRGSLRVDQELLQYGFDSLTFTQLATQCNQLFNIQFTPARFFEFSTVEQCAQYLLQHENKKMRIRYEVKPGPIISKESKTKVQSVSRAESCRLVPKTFNEEIAIIGMQAILPGAKNLDEFWQLLLAGQNSIQEIPPERWDFRVYEKDGVAKWGGFIDGIDEFDPLFFSISPREAEHMDPQHRLFLQVIWQTMEDAGYTLEQLHREKTGLFVGASSQDYTELLQQAGVGGSHASTGVAHSILANRVSYLLNLTGPSEAIDTACSSSLVALHHAIKAIQTGDCKLALVGGVNALLTPSLYISFSKAGMLNQEGQCRTFDKRANGYVRGEGIGAILLKTLSQARKDNDFIYGVIKGSSVNHGGRVGSLTAPNPNAQVELIVDACQRGGVFAESISYVETHGTGTSLGDPIEINGLKKAFHILSREPLQVQLEKPYCALGAVKANIGHLEAAAGIVGIIKVLCMLKYKTIPPQANFELLNPYIELEQSPFYIADRAQYWESPNQTPRRAGISSFGFGGTNAHVLIEEAPEPPVLFGESKPYCLITLSAKHPYSLKQRRVDLYAYLEMHHDFSLENLAYTLNVGRDHFNHRCALVVSSVDELKHCLAVLQQDELPNGCFFGQAKEELEDNSAYKQVLQMSLEKIKKLESRRDCDNEEYREILALLANLYVKGCNFDWGLLHQGENRQKLKLPGYPFLKERYWLKRKDTIAIPKLDPSFNTLPTKLRLTHKDISTSIANKDEESSVSEYNTSLVKSTSSLTNDKNVLDRLQRLFLEEMFLKEEQIDLNKPFAEYGLDSIIGVELIKKVNQEFNLNLSAAKLYDYSTLRGLTDFLLTQIKEPEPTTKRDLTPSSVLPSTSSLTNDKNILDRLQRLFLEEMFLKEEQIDLNKPFAEYGLDSIIGVELIKKVNQEFNLNLSAAKLYDYSTLRGLTDFLLTQIKEPEPTTKRDLTPSSIPEVVHKQTTKQPLYLKKTNADAGEKTDAIAIIGMAGLFPEADSVETFWDNLMQGRSSTHEIPTERWSIAEHYHTDHKVPNKSYSKWGAFIKNVDCFDPLFFGISPAEAERMDPQQRLFLQVSWQAVEDSGYNPLQLDKSRCGIYVGIMNNDYSELISRTQHELTAQQMLGNSNSILAARIAYFLNLKGPVITLDTACSSSLVAIHQACKSLQDGEVDLMLAGGVTLYLSETPYILMSKAGMLSPTGKCKTFDDEADGFVPGEGCGVVVLKRLHDALRDEDTIHGVIRGSGVNQDGKTNGLTAPSALSQQTLLLDVYKKNNIDARLISYVETHGTGTALGDPIEVEALTNAFNAYSAEKQCCALGSVKSNIGHTSAAAGVASVIKVLLMMRHKTLVPSIHYEKPNHHIDFSHSPFYVNTETRSWENRENRPLLAAVSAFGFSGTNAHIVIEEAYRSILVQESRKSHYVITLSAKHPESLNQRVKDLNRYLEKHSNLPLEAIAYTLNTRRAHFHYRYACVAESYEEFKGQLEKLEGGQIPEGCFKGKVEKDLKDRLLYQQILETTIAKLQDFPLNTHVSQYREILEVLADLYAKGLDLDWNVLHHNENRTRVSVPTYPFLKEHYWISEQNLIEIHQPPQKLVRQTFVSLHPLVGKNVSTLEEQRYETWLEPDTFYLKDHLFRGKRILPGVCCLEMAQSAGSLAYPSQEVCGIKNIFWLDPIEVSGTRQISLQLLLKEQQVHFEIQSSEGNKNILHSQGEIIYGSMSSDTSTLDVFTLKQSLEKEFSQEDLYAKFQSNGLCYGPSFQGLQWVKYNARQAFGYIKLARETLQSPDFTSYFLHPSFFDAALQTVIGLHFDQDKNYLPFGIEEIEWYTHALPNEGYVLSELDPQATREMPRYHLKITDSQGLLVLQIKGFCLRMLDEMEEKVKKDVSSQAQLIFYEPKWDEVPLATLNPNHTQITGVFAINISYQSCEQLESALNCEVIGFSEGELAESHTLEMKIASLPAHISHLVYLAKPIKDADSILPVENAFVITQALVKSKRFSSLVGYYLAFSSLSEEIPFVEMMKGFIKSVNQEHIRYRYHLLTYDTQLTEMQALDMWIKEIRYSVPAGIVIRYAENKRYEDRYQSVAFTSNTNSSLPLKKNGVYLITGGLGGLGFHFASYFAKYYQAKLILVGRSQLDDDAREKIKELEKFGSDVFYISANINQKSDVQRLLQEGRKQFSTLQGIIHAAGIVKDSLLIEKPLEDFKAVIAPKVWGAIHLDILTVEDPLDFFVSFSSLSSVFGNIGQSDYASANAFLDHFSQWRQKQVKENKRRGRTLSINWPLWDEGGMQLDNIQKNYLKNSWGIQPLSTEKGLLAFEKLLRLSLPQCIVLFGNPEQLVHLDKSSKLKDGYNDPVANEKIRDWITDNLLQQVSHVLKISKEHLRIDEELTNYGFDSISFTQLTDLCNQFFGIQLTPAHFFEFSTLEQCVHYLMEQESETVKRRYWPDLHAENASKKQTKLLMIPQSVFIKTKGENPQAIVSKPDRQEIAIIGMQAILPGAKNLEEFWKRLLAGEDAIQEVPVERWDWRVYENEGVPKWGGFIDDIDKFDASFFSISSREAECMDPQQRLFLQVVWQAIEDAGYTQEFLSGKKTGLFVGASSQDYTELLQRQGMHEAHTPTGVAHSILANRVSYLLNLTGPSEAIDTACSSSLVALHHAVRAIQSNDCELAIVGGVNVLLSPSLYISFAKAGMLSPVGRCQTFDKRANGYVRGEGVGAVLLKPLTKAQEDNDQIYGVIKGSYVNHGGHVNTITTPNPYAQAQLIIDLYQQEGILPESISYIEAHGTGTNLGDPIEINGLKKAFQTLSNQNISFKDPYCALGSVKANIGHLEAAAGIAGIVKVLCMLKHKTIPPQANFETLNPHIKLDNSPFYITKTSKLWEVKNHFPRRAGVSSFGFGGCNAHIVLEEYSKEGSNNA